MVGFKDRQTDLGRNRQTQYNPDDAFSTDESRADARFDDDVIETQATETDSGRYEPAEQSPVPQRRSSRFRRRWGKRIVLLIFFYGLALVIGDSTGFNIVDYLTQLFGSF